jgi:intracellular septation protein A
MVENMEKIGDAIGVLWAFFQDESGQLTILACLLMAALSLMTAYRCFTAMQPAFEDKLSTVVAVGSAMIAVFGGVGLFFLVQAVGLITD